VQVSKLRKAAAAGMYKMELLIFDNAENAFLPPAHHQNYPDNSTADALLLLPLLLPLL